MRLRRRYELPGVFPLVEAAATRAVAADQARLWIVDHDARSLWSGLTTDLDRELTADLNGRNGHRAATEAAVSGQEVVASTRRMGHLLDGHARAAGELPGLDPAAVIALPVRGTVGGEVVTVAVLEVARAPARRAATLSSGSDDAEGFGAEDQYALELLAAQLRVVLSGCMTVADLKESMREQEVL